MPDNLFTKRHLEFLANALRAMHVNQAVMYPPLTVMADDLAQELMKVVPRFDYNKWMEAVTKED